MPKNVRLVFLPPYSPQLNSVERLWQDLKDHVAFNLHETLLALKLRVREKFESYTDEVIVSVTGYEYLLDAARA